MGTLHDNLAAYFGDGIVTKLRAGDPDIKQIFSNKIIRSADWEWPRPDYVCVDEVLKCSYALEFKPPMQSKREYLTGLGQSLSYLQKHLYAGLIVPTVADDGFHIAKFISDTLQSTEFSDIGLSLYSYNPSMIDNGVTLLRGIEKQRVDSSVKPIDPNKTETFWCWWRDCSQYELYDLLELSFIYNNDDGDVYSDKIFPEFYKKLINGKTKQWDGTSRTKIESEESYKAEKQNYKIPLSQLDLWYEGHLTRLGFKLLEIGKKYGPNSEAFINALGYLLLVNGKHLELIKKIEMYQLIGQDIPASSKQFLLLIERYLTEYGYIGARKPSAITTGAKATYIRDEPKLWNKFGLMKMASKRSYFFKQEGYKFDWHRITDIIVSGGSLLNE